MPRPTSPPPLTTKDRRRRRIERQLRALRVMQDHLTVKKLVYAVLTIPAVALLCLLVAAKLHWLSNSVPLALAGALAAGFVVWLIGRRWLAIAWLIVIALICILLEDVPASTDGFYSGSKPKREKMDRGQKVERAIARREALLRSMDDTT
jgi:uncharacterized membrane protein